MKQFSLAVALSLTLLSVAEAAPIYRCGQTYSQTPCPGGRVIDSSDPRTAAQRAEAKEIAAREKKLAAQMERDRRAREAGEPPAPAAGFDSRVASTPASAASAKAAKPKSSKKKQGGKAATSPDFVAVEPTPPKTPK